MSTTGGVRLRVAADGGAGVVAHAVRTGAPTATVVSTRGPASTAPTPTIAIVLLGTGVVGGALLTLLDTQAAAHVRLVGAANSRHQRSAAGGLAVGQLHAHLQTGGAPRDDAPLLAALDASGLTVKVIVDATASATLAAQHVEWLARGYHVVTANKALVGGALSGWQALQGTLGRHVRYGHSATVGAGLPVLSTVQRLRLCGDCLLALEGVFSGSLSWLFNQYDGSRPFSDLLREARANGYTEPDPRADLSGEDVARKLLIVARSAGLPLDSGEVSVDNLVPVALRDADLDTFLGRMAELDAPLAVAHAAAQARGAVLRFLARLDRHGLAHVGLVEVPLTHPAARLHGTDNQFALSTTRYHAQPLVIQGPGAGPEITAQALLGDVLDLG